MQLHALPHRSSRGGHADRCSHPQGWRARTDHRFRWSRVLDATQGKAEVVTTVTSPYEPQDASACPVLSRLPPPPSPILSPVQDWLLARTNSKKHRFETQAGRPVTAGRFIGMIPSVWVGSVPALKEVSAHEVSGSISTAWPPSTRMLLGEEAVLSVTNPQHHRFLRKLMSGALNMDAVEAYLPAIHDICVNTLESWTRECEQGRTIIALPRLKLMTMEVMTSVVLDMPLTQHELHKVNADFNIWVQSLLDFMPYDVWPLSFYHSMRARERLVARIEKRLAELQSHVAADRAGSKVSMLQLLVASQDDEGQRLTQQQVVDNLMNLLFAGYDTTGTHLCSLLYHLALHPKVLSKVRAEQQQVMSRHGPNMTPAALKDMKYTAAVLQETFRLTPLVNLVPRVANKEVSVGGYKVKAGQAVIPHLGYMMQTDPRWPAEGDPATHPLHPANFNPDRFMTEEGQKQGGQFAFGAGPRTCSGMALAQAESKVFLATLARGYTLTADTNTEWVEWPNVQPRNKLPVWVQRLKEQ